MNHINTDFNKWTLVNESAQSDPTNLDKHGITNLVKRNSGKVIKDLIESGDLDPGYAHNIIARKCIRYGQNDLLDWILPKIEFSKIGPIIGMCYEYRNMDSLDLILKHKKVDPSDIENAILWIKNSPILKNKNEIEYSIEDLKIKFEEI